MGHVGSKTRSLGQFLEKPCVLSRRHSFDPVFMKLCQNDFLTLNKHLSRRAMLSDDSSCYVQRGSHSLPLFYSILFYSIITLEGSRGTTDKFATIPFHLVLFSAALVELAKSIPVNSLILSSHLFFCLPLFLFPFSVPCRIVFAKPEFLTRVRSSSYSPMAAWIFLRTSSLVTWSFYNVQ